MIQLSIKAVQTQRGELATFDNAKSYDCHIGLNLEVFMPDRSKPPTKQADVFSVSFCFPYFFAWQRRRMLITPNGN